MIRIDRTSSSWKLPFALIWLGQACSIFGSSLASFAIIWWLTATTGSATVLATASLATMLPGIIVGPLAGALVDRWDRRTVIMLADLTGALAAAALAYLVWADALQIWHVYMVMAVRSVAGAFHWPAMTASTSLMVPDEQLARVSGLNQMIVGAVNIAAPPLGALLIAIWPLHQLMLVDVVTALIAVATVGMVFIPSPPRTAERLSVGNDIVVGLRYIWRWPVLLGILGMASLINLVLTPAFALLPILVTDHFGGGALELAWVNTANGVGIVVGGLLLGIWGGFRKRMHTSILGLFGLGLGSAVVAFAPSDLLLVGIVGIAVAGMMGPIVNGPFHAIMQSIVAPEMQGRVFTVLATVSMSISPLGLLIAGPVADTFGVQLWYLTGAISCLLLALGSLLSPAVRDLEERAAAQAAAHTAASVSATSG